MNGQNLVKSSSQKEMPRNQPDAGSSGRISADREHQLVIEEERERRVERERKRPQVWSSWYTRGGRRAIIIAVNAKELKKQKPAQMGV